MQVPPDHLTRLGQRLWWVMPRRVYRHPNRGEGFFGWQTPSGFILFGLMAGYYHGYCFRNPRVQYWRRSIWLFGRPALRWRRHPVWIRRPYPII